MNQNSEGSEARPTGIDLGFGGLSADVGGHIGHFYRNEQEMMDVMGPYFEAGLKGGDKCTFICRSGSGETVLAGLANQGIQVEAARSSGQLVLHEGMGSVEATVEMFSDLIAEARAAGYRLIRIGGDMAWGLTKLPSTNELMKWEAMYDLHVAPQFPFLALCQYDLKAFGGEVVLDALKTHPLCIVGKLVNQNPFYTSPEEFLDELAMRSGGEQMDE